MAVEWPNPCKQASVVRVFPCTSAQQGLPWVLSQILLHTVHTNYISILYPYCMHTCQHACREAHHCYPNQEVLCSQSQTATLTTTVQMITRIKDTFPHIFFTTNMLWLSKVFQFISHISHPSTNKTRLSILRVPSKRTHIFLANWWQPAGPFIIKAPCAGLSWKKAPMVTSRKITLPSGGTLSLPIPPSPTPRNQSPTGKVTLGKHTQLQWRMKDK